MGIFSEGDLPDVEPWPPDEVESLDRKVRSALSDLEFLEVTLAKLIDRARYHDEPPVTETLEQIRLDIRHVIKVLL